MSDFRFLHAADIHLDSPLHGLARYEGVPVDEVRGATRAAFDNLVAAAREHAVDFMVIAGDLFDGDWKDMGTGLYFARAMAGLANDGIPVFVLNGNHDAASILTKALPLPEAVHVFGSRKPETFVLEALGVALHGRSFPTAHVHEDMTAQYPAPRSGFFNIGVLHTALSGFAGHAPYAPCTIEGLAAKGYDYWALGHVHEHQILNQAPWVVFPGNLQGRHARETGAKGAVLVEVSDRTVSSVKHLALDVMRWMRIETDCDGAETDDAIYSRVLNALADTYATEADGRPGIARVTLTGTTSRHGALQDGQARLRDDVRALALQVSPDLWIEKVVVHTAPPVQPSAAVVTHEFAGILEEALTSAELAAALQDDLTSFLTALPALPEGMQEEGLQAAARDGDWRRLVEIGSTALRARLMAGDA